MSLGLHLSTLDMNILNLKLDKEKVVIAKIKVVILITAMVSDLLFNK